MGYAEKVVIVGAGISGLACAHYLKKRGIPSLVLEASDRPGGVIHTVRRNGFVFEIGPQFPRFPASLMQVIRDLHLEAEFIAGDSRAKRYIFRKGTLHDAPLSPLAFLRTPLVGFKSKLRMVSEPFGYSHPPDEEESLADFVLRKFDVSILDNLVDPFISTVFLGDPRKMGMLSAFPALVDWERRRGSLFRGALIARKSKQGALNRNGMPKPGPGKHSMSVTDSLPTLGSFQSGMGALPEALATELEDTVRYNIRISSISETAAEPGASASHWRLTLGDREPIVAEHLVLAVPAYVAASLLAPTAQQTSSLLHAIEYAPICVVCSAYAGSQITNGLDGFGFMVPRREGLHTISTFWNSSLFSNRAPAGSVLLTSFAGRDANDALYTMPDQASAQTIESENAKILGISGEPLDRVVWKDSYALPQYNVGHVRLVSQITESLRTRPNLHLAGNFLTGRSIGDCLDLASRVAENLHTRLASS
jgi:oxygen-dependent protoporphyrinogen oxidase